MANITKRKDSYRIKVSCGYDMDGKQVTQSMTWKPEAGMTAKQIEKELNRQAVMFEEACQGKQIVNTVKFEAFAEQWFKEYANVKLKEKTVERYRQLTERSYKAIGHIRLDKVTPRNIQNFITSLEKDGINKKTGGKLSPKTIKHYVSFISAIYDYAIKMQMISDNPCKYVTIPNAQQLERDCYTLEEAQHFLELLTEAPTKYQAFFTLAIYGGFRRGEILGLEWKDIDFKTGVISIRRTALYSKNKGHFTDTPKTKGSIRSLKLPESVMLILKRHQNEQFSQRLKLGDQWNETDRLFTTWNGLQMDGATPYSWLKKFCQRHDMRFVNLHSFRHLNASLLINSGVNIRTVSACLGHSQTSTTLNIYAHTFEQANAKAMEAVANALELSGYNDNKKQA